MSSTFKVEVIIRTILKLHYWSFVESDDVESPFRMEDLTESSTYRFIMTLCCETRCVRVVQQSPHRGLILGKCRYYGGSPELCKSDLVRLRLLIVNFRRYCRIFNIQLLKGI